MTEHFFTTTAGVRIPIQPISLLDLQLAQNAVEEQFREGGEPVDPPMYEVRLELEDTSEYHPHTKVTIKDATNEEKEAWQKYLETVSKMQDETEQRTALVFLEGIIVDLPEDDKWIKRRKKLFNEDVPEDEDERKLHYIDKVLLKTPADKDDLTVEIHKLSMTGASEEAIAAWEELFRGEMELQKRKALKEAKARIQKETEGLVLQPAIEGRDSSEGPGNDNGPIQEPAKRGTSKGNRRRKNVVKDG